MVKIRASVVLEKLGSILEIDSFTFEHCSSSVNTIKFMNDDLIVLLNLFSFKTTFSVNIIFKKINKSRYNQKRSKSFYVIPKYEEAVSTRYNRYISSHDSHIYYKNDIITGYTEKDFDDFYKKIKQAVFEGYLKNGN